MLSCVRCPISKAPSAYCGRVSPSFCRGPASAWSASPFLSLRSCSFCRSPSLPAFGIALFGLAIVEKDGLAVLVGLAVGVASLVVAAAVVIGLIKAFLLLFSGMLN